MAFNEEYAQPKNISYMDLYLVANKFKNIEEASKAKCDSHSEDMLFGFPRLSHKDVMKCLWELGVNTNKEIEENYCYHRPVCLAMSSPNASSPVVYGLCYFGTERTDTKYLKGE